MTDTNHTKQPDERTLLLDLHAMFQDQQQRQMKLEKENKKIIAKQGMLSANLSLILDKLETFSCSLQTQSDLRSLMSSVDDVRSRASLDSPCWSDDDDDDDKESVHFSANESLIYDPKDSPQEVKTGERNTVSVE